LSNVKIEKDVFGRTADGIQVDRYTLCNSSGATVRLITYGATVTELCVPDREGRLDDVVLGFDSLRQYEAEHPYFGCIVGRVAFRITRGRFELDGTAYQLTLNNGPHHLHGGTRGFSRVVWKAAPVEIEGSPGVRFRHVSPGGDQGYPGELIVTVDYSLNDHNEMTIDYRAVTDAPTPVNLTHHGYFNLAGAGSGDVLGHVLWLDADRYSVTDDALIPTGQLAPVKGTPFDFNDPTAVGARMRRAHGKAAGYDLAYLLSRTDDSPAHVVTMFEPRTGRVMEVETTAPAMVFYTGEYLDGTLRGKGDVAYAQRAGFCLEPGHLPDAVHHPNFPSVILRPAEAYRQTSVYRFLTKGTMAGGLMRASDRVYAVGRRRATSATEPCRTLCGREVASAGRGRID
jgi:aldose 1-epimerase